MNRLAFAATVSGLLWGAPRQVKAQAHAPTVWERAARPSLGSADEAHRELQSLLLPVVQIPGGDYWESSPGQEQIRNALELLETAHAEQSPDVRLHFDEGRVALLAKDYARCRTAYEAALRDAPDHPMAVDGYFELGICYAKLDDSLHEIACYDAFLRVETRPSGRARAMMNRGESLMRLGRLPGAIEDFRASLAITPDQALTHWDLAVSLDRSGDATGALTEARAAITYDPLDQQLTRGDVFFVPAYDLSYYQALGAMARAQGIDDNSTSILWWETATARWSEYIALAPASDPWLALARAHKGACEKQLAQVKKKATRRSKAKRAER